MFLARRLLPGEWEIPLAVGSICTCREPILLGQSYKHALVSYVSPASGALLISANRVEQPIGTGFAIGTPTATNEEDVAAQFLGFFENFQKMFGIKNFKIYVTGESYGKKVLSNLICCFRCSQIKTL